MKNDVVNVLSDADGIKEKWKQYVDDMQYGSMSGKGTTNVIFIMRQSSGKASMKEEAVLCSCGFGEGI